LSGVDRGKSKGKMLWVGGPEIARESKNRKAGQTREGT